MPFGRRILVVVPHPDDEIVAMGGAIQHVIKHGCSVFLLRITHGCIARDALWPWQKKDYGARVARRLAESEKAAAFLGATLIQPPPDRPTRSTRFFMPQIADEIAKAMHDYAIDQVWVPAYEGGHPDHDILNAIVYGLCTKTGVSAYEFAAYNYFQGHVNSQTFPLPHQREDVLVLGPTEREEKGKALAIYASERQNLAHVATKIESFRPLIGHDYAAPPHIGTLWYARFHWVPFRHPRIDRTTPSDVSHSILDFLRARGIDIVSENL